MNRLISTIPIMMEYTQFACLVKSIGPGWIPCIVQRTEQHRRIGYHPDTQRQQRIIVAPVTALLEDSQATSPSSLPMPYSSGCLLVRCASLYARKESNCRARARNSSSRSADDARLEQHYFIAKHIRKGNFLFFHCNGGADRLVDIAALGHDLCNCKQTNEHRDDVKSTRQIVVAECKRDTPSSCQYLRSQQQTGKTHQKTLEYRFSADAGNNGQTEKGKRKILTRTKSSVQTWQPSGAQVSRITQLIKPPIIEAASASCRARLACPCCAIGYPSRLVAAEAGGAWRIDQGTVMEPP